MDASPSVCAPAFRSAASTAATDGAAFTGAAAGESSVRAGAAAGNTAGATEARPPRFSKTVTLSMSLV